LRAQRYIDKNCKDGSATLKIGPPDQRTGGQQEYARDWRQLQFRVARRGKPAAPATRKTEDSAAVTDDD